MDLNNLLQALQYSVGKTVEEVKMAEQFLLQAKSLEGYIPNLLLITCNKDVHEYVRQAAIIRLKAIVHDHWGTPLENEMSISLNDKETLRESILDALIKCVDTPKVYRQMEEIVKCVADFDFPTSWRSILPNVVNKLKTSDKFSEIYGSLLVLKNLVVPLKNAEDQEREPLEIIVSNTFSLLEVYAKNLLSNYNEQSATAMHAILKTFFAATYTAIPKYFMDEKVVESWMTFFKLIVDKTLDNDLISPTSDQDTIHKRAKNIFWLNKKNCGRILVHFIRTYVTPKPKRDFQYQGVSQLFLNKYAVPFLESFIQILSKKKDEYVPVKVQYFAMRYIYRALNFPDLEKLLLNYLEPLMFDFLIPSMFLTVDDDDDWRNNPIEFIRKEADILERPNNLKSVAKDYFITICASDYFAPDGELFLIKFMKYAAAILTAGVDPRTNQETDQRMKEAIMNIIGNLKEPILQNDYLRENMEFLLEKYVVPEFKNNIGFLRYRACWLFGIYGSLDYKNRQIVRDALEGLYTGLLDSEFPVRVNAGVGLYRLLPQPETAEALTPHLQKVLQIYLSLIDQMDNEELLMALEALIAKFENEIHPFAIELVEHLANTFYKALNDEKEDGSDDGEDEEKTFASSECLSAIVRIIKCELSKETVAKIEEICHPIIQYSLTEEGADFIYSGLDILGSLLSKNDTVSPKLWQFFCELNYIMSGKPDQLLVTNFAHLSEEKKAMIREQSTGWGYEFVDDIVPLLQNYIQKGRETFFNTTDPYFNITYLELVFRSIERMYNIFYTKKSHTEAVFISLLFICLLENYPKQIDHVLPAILDKTIHNLNFNDIDFKKILIEITCMCFWYDPILSIQYLESKGATQFVFEKLGEVLSEYNEDFECQRIMLGLSSLLKVDVSNFPQVIIGLLPNLLREMVKLSNKILEIREKAEYEDEAEEDEEEKKTLQRLQRINQNNEQGVDVQNEEDDDDDDDSNYNDLDEFEADAKGTYNSPLEDICEILHFKESLGILQQINGDAYNQLLSCLGDDEKMALQTNFEKAYNQEVEFQKFKQDEAQKKQMRLMGNQR